MDPNANLREQLSLAREIQADMEEGEGDRIVYQANRLSELVLALDEWLRGGGFPPANWSGHDPGCVD